MHHTNVRFNCVILLYFYLFNTILGTLKRTVIKVHQNSLFIEFFFYPKWSCCKIIFINIYRSMVWYQINHIHYTPYYIQWSLPIIVMNLFWTLGYFMSSYLYYYFILFHFLCIIELLCLCNWLTYKKISVIVWSPTLIALKIQPAIVQ